jgi:5'-methylthioadenosine/S-adenosylhomocysteine nucleosidase
MILILGAMDAEITAFLSAMQDRVTTSWKGMEEHSGSIDGHAVLLSRSGVGKAMSALRTQYLICKHTPTAVLFTGLAGSLRTEIEIGDTVLAADLVQHDLDTATLGFPRGHIPFTTYRFLTADPALLHAAATYAPAKGRLHQGRICTGDQFITHRDLDSHRYLHDELAGHAVEMEGASVALVCTLNDTPYLVVRTISDKADGSAIVNFSDFLPQASLNSLALVRHMLAHWPL